MGSILDREITYIKGVGAKKAEILNTEAGIYTVRDLLEYYPYRYIDRREFNKIGQTATNESYVQIKGRFINASVAGTKPKQRLIATFSDGTGTIELVWFKGIGTIKEIIDPEETYVVFGKLGKFNNKPTMVHPDFEKQNDFLREFQGNFSPMYNTSEKMKRAGLHSKAMLKIIRTVLSEIKNNTVPETLPAKISQKCHLSPLKECYEQIHFPADKKVLEKIKFRIKFEELFYIQLNVLKKKDNQHKHSAGQIFGTVGKHFMDFYENNLPFELTGAQKRVIKEIRKDTATGKQMNRLVQGDVGSGKTLVALLAMLIAIDNSFQACMMAPTEILATQHFQSIKEFLGNSPIKIALLTGSTKKKERGTILEGLQNGTIDIVVGTHALIEDPVIFKNIGIAVIDEQHRFGVAQRAKLWAKNKIPPHILVMTATPIPRTLAMTLYGDLDISVIDELPPGRKPVKTVHYFDNKRQRLFGFLKDQIALGRQVYVVYPLIKESEKMDYKDLEDGYESICRAFPRPEYQISVVHGKMKATDKDFSMKHFAEAKSQIMVATTVIEVGVNVPNASVMVIESAERFGLSQLHQLRGRVGRGADQSYCILMSSYKLSEESKKRLQTMVESNDGFVIAEADLKLRGPGDIEGTQQSGLPVNLKMANLAKDGKILQFARDIAESVLAEDKELTSPENQILAKNLSMRFGKQFNWRHIS